MHDTQGNWRIPSLLVSAKGGEIFQDYSGFEPVSFLIDLDTLLVNWGRYPSICRGMSCFLSDRLENLL